MLDEVKDRAVLLSDIYKRAFHGEAMRPGATEAQVNALVTFAGLNVSEDYLDFLRTTNGFLELGDIDYVIRNSTVWRQHWPGCLIIGSDGGEGHFLLDLAYDGIDGETKPVLYFENEGLELDNNTPEWLSFSKFFLDFFTAEHILE